MRNDGERFCANVVIADVTRDLGEAYEASVVPIVI